MKKPKTNILMPKIYVSKPITVRADPKRLHRIDIEFHGVNHFGVSYEARIFLNNTKATYGTIKSESQGYAGSFYIFGHGGRCYGGPGHCTIPTEKNTSSYDLRRSHPLTPTFKCVTVTKILSKILKKRKQVTVTIVPIPQGYDEMADMENLLQFERLAIVSYDK